MPETVVSCLLVREDTGFVLSGTEADMQCALKQQPGLIEPGLTIIDHELPTGVGSIDLYARDAQSRLMVIELKRGKATHEAVHQLARYVEQGKAKQLPDTHVRGLLVAPDATGPALKQLAALGLEFKRLTALPELEQHNPQATLF